MYDRTWRWGSPSHSWNNEERNVSKYPETEFQRSAQMLFPDGNYLFQQDNDPKHTAGVVQNYIRQSGIRPAQSPDLNPIENLWAILDLKLQSRKPNTEAELFEQLQRT